MVWPYRMSPAAMNTGSLLSWLVMLSTENWEMLSQLLVCTSGSWESREPWVRSAKHRPHFVTRSSSHFACLPPLHRDRPPHPRLGSVPESLPCCHAILTTWTPNAWALTRALQQCFRKCELPHQHYLGCC